MADTVRLTDEDVEQRLAHLDELLERVESVAGPAADAALAAVRGLTEIYGEALSRIRDLAGPGLAEQLTGDQLLDHLLVLHRLHPDPVEQRVATAVEHAAEALRPRGATLELLGIDEGVAAVRLTTKGCGGSASGAEEAVRDALLAAAPELLDVRRVPDEPAAAFVPLETLLPATAPAAGTA
ncbi:NifU family protein [Streptomyces sp. WMMB303]|uniref:NifU family protein n=1 Tax=Streptomyces sp. WMMB303 TaxID=3034154 RepID=UPI0023EC1DFD|nr:NifU family protein [Streptomyces sp. WMMB303]MDF4252523.1 NifU family protein [Streptomyces sp. WMMB303]